MSSPESTNWLCSKRETDASCCLFCRLRFIVDMLVCVCVSVCIGYGVLRCFWVRCVKSKHAHPPFVITCWYWVADAGKAQSASKNGKKSDSGSSSFFTWFIVLALLGVWTSVAVVYFDLVDYQGVLGEWSPKLASMTHEYASYVFPFISIVKKCLSVDFLSCLCQTECMIKHLLLFCVCMQTRLKTYKLTFLGPCKVIFRVFALTWCCFLCR